MKGERALEKLTTAGAKAETSVNKLTREVQAGRQTVQTYENSIAGTRRQIAEAARAWSQAGTATREATAGIAAAKERIESATQTLVRQRRELKENEAALLNYKRAGQSSVTGMKLLQRSITEQRAEIRASNSAIRQAEREIEKYGRQGEKAAKQVGETRDRIATLRTTLERQNSSLKNAEAAFRANVQAHGRARRATRQTTEAVQELTGAARAQATSIRAAGVSAHQATNQAAALAHQSGASARHVANLSAQFNDIGVMLASGQNPLLLALQQGTQINQVFQTMGQKVGTVQSLWMAFKAIISPTSLATIAIIAGGAALAQWGIRAVTAGRETRTLKDLMEDLTEAVNEYESASRASLQSQEDLIETYGRHADRVRDILRAQRALAEDDALTQARALPFTSDDLHILVEAAQAGDTAKHVFLDVANSIREAMAELAGAEGPEEILAGLRKVENLRQKLVGMVGLEGEGKEFLAEKDREITASMLKREETIARISGLREKESEDAKAEREERERLAEVAERMLGTGRESIQLKAAELVYGRDSLAYALERLDIELRSKGITGAQAAERRQQVTSEYELTQRIKERAEAAEEQLRLQREEAVARERALEVGGRIIQQSRQENELLAVRAEFGQNSTQYKEAERRVERENLEIQLQSARVEEGNADRARANLAEKHRLLDVDQARIELEKKLIADNQVLVGAAQALTKEKERQIDAEIKAREAGQLVVEQAQAQNSILEARAFYGRESLQYLEAEREIERENLELKLKRSGIEDGLAQKALGELSRRHELLDIERERIAHLAKLTSEQDALTAAAKEFAQVEEESIEISAKRLEQYISLSNSLSDQIELNKVEAIYGRQSIEYLQQQQIHRARALEADMQRLGLSKKQTAEIRKQFTDLVKQEQSAHRIAEQQERLLESSKAIMAQERDLAKLRKEEEKRLERLAEAEENAVRSMRDRAALSTAELTYGQGSIELLRARHEIERQNLDIEIKKSEYRDETAQALRDELSTIQQNEQVELQRAVTEKERAEAQKQNERIAKAIAKAYQAQLRIIERREEVENRLTQGLENRLRVARFSLQYGRDSVEVQNVLRNIERERLDTLLDQERITGNARDRIIEMHEAAEQLDIAIEQNEEVMRGVLGVVDDISTAWGEFVIRGFDDFKGFAKSVFNVFKRLLVQMVAEAAKAKILNFLGFGNFGGGGNVAGNVLGSIASGTVSSIAGSATTSYLGLGSVGGGAGAAAAGGGGISPLLRIGGQIFGRLSGITDKLTAAIGIGASSTAAAGTAAANTFAAYGPGQAAASVAAAGAAPAAGAGAFAGLAAAAPWIIGAIAVFSLLSAKWKTVDTGVRITTDNLETMVEAFEKQKKSRFIFGSKRRTRTEEIDEEAAAPIKEAVGAVWTEVRRAADALGIGADAFKDFRKTIDISFRGLDESQREEKFAEAMRELQEDLAATALASAGVSFEADKATERLNALVQTLTTVNAVLDRLGNARLDSSVEGARRAEDLIERFGGAGQFTSAVDAFYQNFYTEAERMVHLRTDLQEAFSGFDLVLPESLKGYRDLVSAQDLMTDKGQELYASLIALSGSFSQLIAYEEKLAETRRREVEASLQPGIRSAQQAATGVNAIRNMRQGVLAPTNFEDASSQLDLFRRASAIQVEQAKDYARRSARQAAASSSYAASAANHAADASRAQSRASAATARASTYTARATEAVAAASRFTAEGNAAAAKAANARAQSAKEAAASATSAANSHSSASRAARAQSAAAAAASRAAAAAARRYAREASARKELSELLFEIRHLGLQFDVTHDKAVRFGKELVKIGGGLDEFGPKLSSYYENFFSEQERISNLWADLTLDFDHLGVSMPSTIDSFRHLVESQDLMTKEGRELFVALVEISDAFALAKRASEEARRAEEERRSALRDAFQQNSLSLTRAFDGEIAAIDERIGQLSRRFNEMGRSIPSVDAAFRKFTQEIRELYTVNSPFLRDIPAEGLQEINQYLEELTTLSTPEALRELIDELDTSTDSGLRFHQTLSEMALEFKELTEQSEELTAQIAEQRRSNHLTYLREFGGPAAEVGQLMKELVREFDRLNLALPASHKEFRELVESIDPATDSGANLIRELYALAGQFDDVQDRINSLSTDRIEDAVDQIARARERAIRQNTQQDAETQIRSDQEGFQRLLEGFFPERAVLDRTFSGLTHQFNLLGVTVPQTRDMFVDLVTGLNLATEGGRSLYSQLLGLAGPLDDFFSRSENFHPSRARQRRSKNSAIVLRPRLLRDTSMMYVAYLEDQKMNSTQAALNNSLSRHRKVRSSVFRLRSAMLYAMGISTSLAYSAN